MTSLLKNVAKHVVVCPVVNPRPKDLLDLHCPSCGLSTVAEDDQEQKPSDGQSSAAERKTAAHERNLMLRLLKYAQPGLPSCLPLLESPKELAFPKVAMEQWLTQVGFNYPHKSDLDGFCNIPQLFQDLQLDKYGAIAFTPPPTFINSLIARLWADNEDWEIRCSLAPDAPRNLTNPIYDSANVDWHVLELHPENLLPSGQPFLALKPWPDSRTPTPVIPKDHYHLNDGPVGFWLPILCLDDKPLALRPTSRLSLFSMLINLHAKVAAFEAADAPIIYRMPLFELKTGLEELVKLIFHFAPNWSGIATFLNAASAADYDLASGPPVIEEVSVAPAESMSDDDEDDDSDDDDDDDKNNNNTDDGVVPGVGMSEWMALSARGTELSGLEIYRLAFGTRTYERPYRPPWRAQTVAADADSTETGSGGAGASRHVHSHS